MAVKCCSCWRLGVPPTWLVLCGAFMVQVGYGLYPVVVKRFAVVSSPLVFSFYRDALCAPLLFLCAFIGERKILFPRPKMLLVFLLLGMIGIFGSQLLYILGVYYAGPDVASSIQPIIPVWTTVLVIVTCTEKIPAPLHVHTWVKVFGIVISVGGAIEIALTQDNDSDADSQHPHSSHHISKHILGYICLFANTISTSVYIVLQKRFIFKQRNSIWKSHPIHVTAYSYLFGMLFMGLSSLYYVGKKDYSAFVIKGETFYALIYAVFIAAAVCYLFFSWSNMHLSPTVVTAFWPVQVLVTALAAFFITGDQLAPLQYIGAVMVILALFMVLFSNYMDERLQSGQRVPQINCRMSKRPLPILDDYEYVINNDETVPLLYHIQKESLSMPPPPLPA